MFKTYPSHSKSFERIDGDNMNTNTHTHTHTHTHTSLSLRSGRTSAIS